ncbi:MAG TPA: hypothetical protein VK511_03345 [Gemmatimonadaceae bacterium]|nr:hypothetical protein [Gemmatimonadaceae bacterium]
MRTVRWMSSVLALVALMPAVSAAQSNRLFENAWFWGAKAGLMNFSTGIENKTAPLVGAEWLITRNRAGLYLSAEQAFFNATGYVVDGNGTPVNVALKDSRRYTAALLAFPVNWGSLRPYGGVGLGLNLIQHATVDQSQITDPDQEDVIANAVHEERDRVAFLIMGGLQAQYRRFSVFGQATYMPARANFFFSGRSTYILEAGIRYNVGSSIDKTP